MLQDEVNPVVEILKDANSRLGADRINLVGGVDESTYRRWFAIWGPAPTPVRARLAGCALWKQLEDAGPEVREAILNCVARFAPRPPNGWTEQSFAAVFFQLADGYRHKRSSRSPRARKAPLRSRRGPAHESVRPVAGATVQRHPFDPTSHAHQRVNALFQAADMPVVDGFAHCGDEVRLHLGPLYAYMERLQESARVPNQFAPGGLIELDELYVELMAAEDQRGAIAPGTISDSGGVLAADLPTSGLISQWRKCVEQHRIPVEALVSRTEVIPAVLFGDPGSGKSTLTHFLLHALGRGFATGKGTVGSGALPFRISLSEFTVAAADCNYEVIRYLARDHLRVPAEELDDWQMMLVHLFANQRPFRLLVIFDGIDEATPNTPVFPTLRQRLGDISAVARVLFTSRRAGFLPPVVNYATFELVELAEPAMVRLVENWFRHVIPRSASFVQSFVLWLFADPGRHEMARNPCLLSLLCYLNQACPEDGFIQAVNRSELYRLGVEKLTSDAERLRTVDKESGLDALSGFALDRYLNLGQATAPHALFSREEIRQFLSSNSADRRMAEAASTDSPLTHHLDHMWLRTRLVSKWNEREWYCFQHLSFQEYFAARCLVTRPEPEVQALLAERCFDPYWQEVWRFYAGLCRGQGVRGESRFGTLARAVISTRDFYDQCLFWFAPLCAEYGMQDTRALLGFDLRTGLYRQIASGTSHTLAHMRAIVDIDPEFFLDRVEGVLSRQIACYRKDLRDCRERRFPDEEEVRSAVAMLECICNYSGQN